jgi:signal transduction histidine kinase
VQLEWAAGELVLTVTDDGIPHAGPAPTAPGRGIRGMRDRVEHAGGHLEGGPQEHGGWRIRAAFPLPTAATGD